MDLSKLNPMQREAVLYDKGPLLILAGAGSGKTRTVTYRIAQLIENGTPPYNILALTFTNKAANEMKERVTQLVGSGDVWVSTFHSLCVKILRRHIDRIGYQKSFTIYDDTDQLSLVGDILKKMNIDDDLLPKRRALSLISEAKNRSAEPVEYLQDRCSYDITLRGMEEIYKEYTARLFANNALDFDDLLLLTIKLFENCADVLEYYQQRFEYIHVDEYQDTNLAQYTITRMLCATHQNICVVGDDDQGIYSWRGADIRNILDFEKDFPNAKVIRLEQNYRSTSTILDAANAVIENNTSRKKKKLWTDLGTGEKITLHVAGNEHAEARFICEKIEELCEKGFEYGDFAILYRLNSQSRVLEEMLLANQIPRKVFGGVGFYQRKEIKDIIAYLRVINNPADDVSLKRIINNPKRGIGDTAVAQMEAIALEKDVSLFSIILDAENSLGDLRSKKKVMEFSQTVKLLIAKQGVMGFEDFVNTLLRETGYQAQYEKLSTDEARSRLENIQEFVTAAQEFEQSTGGDLAAFLETVALVSDMDSMEEVTSYVSLMTMHSAKGLEFPVVFITGMEDGIFPHSRSRNNVEEMEEERRLCYVGMTRAKKKLFLSRSVERNMFGKYSINLPSCFIREIPQELFEEVKKDEPMRSINQKKATNRQQEQRTFTPAIGKVKQNEDEYTNGLRVLHGKFGKGTIIETSGRGPSKMVTVDFDDHGTKKLALSFAPLDIIEK
ncbi:DNA helicase PcrA [Clostridia bacterium OttesenSCG-928-F22]|nr:DNA helicase PcrA [Clostridia bacterium OttesenSCG-928-F22]